MNFLRPGPDGRAFAFLRMRKVRGQRDPHAGLFQPNLVSGPARRIEFRCRDLSAVRHESQWLIAA